MKTGTSIDSLINSLMEMIKILSLDSSCPWLPVFSALLEKAESLKLQGGNRNELIDLVSSIIDLYSSGSGFTDYAPLEFNPGTRGYYYIIGAENFAEVSHELFSAATAVRSITGFYT